MPKLRTCSQACSCCVSAATAPLSATTCAADAADAVDACAADAAAPLSAITCAADAADACAADAIVLDNKVSGKLTARSLSI